MSQESPSDATTGTRRQTRATVELVVEVDVVTDDLAGCAEQLIGHLTELSTRLGGRPDVTGVRVTRQHLARSEPAPVRGVFLRDLEQLVVDGVESKLTPREATVLGHLVDRPDRTVTREELQTALDDAGGSLGPRAVDVIVSRLRAKLPYPAQLIVTVRGIGYRYRSSSYFEVVSRSE